MAAEPPSLLADPELQATEWDLDPLVDGRGADGVKELLDEADELASGFAGRYQGKVAELDAEGLTVAMHEMVRLYEVVDRAASYAYLRFSTDTADPERGALLQLVQERGTAIETQVLFFELEWAALPDERADELLAADGLDFARHYLEKARRYRPHLLSEPEERLVAEKSVTGRGAWTRLFSEVTSAITVQLPEEAQESEDEQGDVSLEVALSKLQSSDRDVRARRRRGDHRRARAGAPHARLHLQHADARQGRRRPAALLPHLALGPQPRERGERRVGAGAARRPCAPATTSRAAGTRSRRGCSGSTSSPTTTAWPASAATTARCRGTRRASS